MCLFLGLFEIFRWSHKCISLHVADSGWDFDTTQISKSQRMDAQKLYLFLDLANVYKGNFKVTLTKEKKKSGTHLVSFSVLLIFYF